MSIVSCKGFIVDLPDMNDEERTRRLPTSDEALAKVMQIMCVDQWISLGFNGNLVIWASIPK